MIGQRNQKLSAATSVIGYATFYQHVGYQSFFSVQGRKFWILVNLAIAACDDFTSRSSLRLRDRLLAGAETDVERL